MIVGVPVQSKNKAAHDIMKAERIGKLINGVPEQSKNKAAHGVPAIEWINELNIGTYGVFRRISKISFSVT